MTKFPTGLALLAAIATATAVIPKAAHAQSLAFTPVTVIDVREGVARSGQTVLVDGNEIVVVGPADSVDVPAEARVVDGTGKFLIPGLWDMHAHTSSDRISRQVLLPLFVANGVTGIRIMSADCFETGEPNCGEAQEPIATIEDVREWRRQIATGRLFGPRIVAGSYYVNSPPVGEPSTRQYPRTAEHGRAHARLLHERGVDFIKIYDLLSREAYFALADEANRLGVPFAGHVPVAVRASEASEAGQRSIEHCCAGNVLEQCSAREYELRDRILTEIGSNEPEMLPLMLQLVESYDADKCAELFATFVENGTWFVPTLMIERLPSEVGAGWRHDPRRRFLPREEREYFAEAEEFYDSLVGDEAAREPYSRWVRTVTEAMHRAGVRFLAGSDAGYPGIFWGSALHEELEVLTRAGLTEADALRAATLEPARYLEATDSLGTVEAGKLADLVLLEANPLEDITNTREIAAVVLDGRYLDREALDQMLAEAERVANPPDATDDSVPHEEPSPADEARGDTVHVAPPTGEQDADRASILAALEEVRPGGTVQFAAGTYLVGPVVRVETPRLTLQGHPDGTVLRGCDHDEYEASDREVIEAEGRPSRDVRARCGMFELSGGDVTVRGLTFENSRLGLLLGCCHLEPRSRVTPGGYTVEGNVFRNSLNGVRPWTTEPSVIRGNRFVNTFHAISGVGSHLSVLDNEISVPDPSRVRGAGHPSFAVSLGPLPGPAANALELDDNGEGFVIADNRIRGHPDGISVAVYPGTSFRGNEIRGNDIEVTRVPIPPAGPRSYIVDMTDESDSTVVGVPMTFYARSGFGGGGAEELEEGRFEDNLIEGNRLVGAEGVALALQRARRNRIVGNAIVGVDRREPFPGNTVLSSSEAWREANGSAIWLSPDSNENEIAGNTFEDIEAAAVFLEGDDNRVALRDASDVVRDLGTENQVSVAQEAAIEGEWVAVDGEMYGAPVPDASLPLLRFAIDDGKGRWTIPGHPQRFSYTAYGEAAPDSLDLHLPIDGPRTWLIPVRSGLRGDTLDVAFPLAEPYDSARAEPPGRPESAAPGASGAYLRLSMVRRSAEPLPTSSLTEEETEAAGRVDADAIERRTRALVTPEMEGRESGEPGGERAARVIAEWFREAGLEPLGEDGFLQRVPLILGRATPTSSLTVGDTTFHVGDDFAIGSLPMRTRPAMRFDATGEVVLFGPSLGYGRADAPLPELDVEGKIVAWVASAGPADGSPADFMRTYEVLHRNGAVAVIALFPGPVPEAWLRSPVFSEVGALDADLYGSGPARPLVLLGQEAFGALFGDGSEVRSFMSGFTPGEHRVRPTGREVTLSYEIEETTAAPTHNVVGVLRGSDPEQRDEAVVYTAHYDAFGTYDGEVYPGAADNALGVAEMIEIADALRESGVRPRRSLVFLAVGAEERGMLGTLHWTRHPTWPLDRVVANINMDGGDAEAWGPLHGVIDLTRQATLVDPAAEVAAAMGVPVLPDNTSGGWSGSSDFYDFLRAGVPAIQLMGIGGDPALSRMRMQRFGGQRVHQPGDTIDEGWDWTGPREMAKLYLLLGLRVANAEEPPRIRASSPSVPSGPDAAVASIAAPDMAREIGVLAHDSMAGRDTPSPELEAAAAYLAERFRSMGLEPAGDDGNYLYRYEFGRVRLLPGETRVGVRGQATRNRHRFDYFLAPADRPVVAEAVYVGVAGRTEALQDAGGKVLLFDLPGAEPDAGWNGRAASALQLAAAAGAAGVVLVLDPALPRYRINELASGMAQQRLPIPLVGMTEAAARALVADVGAELDELRAAGPPAPLGDAVLEIRTRAAEDPSTAPNVSAVLPGSDPDLQDTHVVLTAHFDHVGVGAPDASGDSIFNGADDNASGTAALLEIAEAFAALPEPPARSVVFLATSGEEKGILGARAYVQDPPAIDLEGVVANVNLDLIGRGPPDTVVATGQQYSSLEHTLRRIVADHPGLGLNVAVDSGQAGRPLLLASDQVAFVEKGIPAVFLSGGAYGVHHTPADEASLVDHDKAARTARLAFLLAHEIASSREEPTWTEEGWAEVQRMLGGQ